MYGKIFTSIFDSSLVAEGGWLPTYIFMSMVTVADKDGLVSIAPKALYRRLGFREYESKVSFTEFEQALQYLQSRDGESNSPAHNGRRIVPLSEIEEVEGNRGWLIVNYMEYRKKGSREEQGASTDRVRRFREKRKNNDLQKGNANVTQRNGRNGHTDTDTDTKKEGAETLKRFALPEWVDQTAWDEFDQHRRSTSKLRSTWNTLAKTKSANQLKGLSPEQQRQVVDYSIAGGYPGLYPERIKPATRQPVQEYKRL